MKLFNFVQMSRNYAGNAQFLPLTATLLILSRRKPSPSSQGTEGGDHMQWRSFSAELTGYGHEGSQVRKILVSVILAVLNAHLEHTIIM